MAGHPGPARVRLSREIATEIVARASEAAPAEACGVVLGTALPGDGGRAVSFAPCRNTSPLLTEFEIHPEDLLRVLLEGEAAGLEPWAWVHSHVASEARPSRTDVERAAWPDQLYVLVSLAPDRADPATGAPSLRAWRILDGVVHEVALEVA